MNGRLRGIAPWLPLVLLAWALATAAVPAQDEDIPFSHNFHVPVEWAWSEIPDRENPLFGNEVARDCRGCHDFSTEDVTKRRKPSEACQYCHVYDTVEIKGKSYLDDVREDRAYHYAHREQSCKTCHNVPRPKGDYDSNALIPMDMPVPDMTNMGYCVDCHSKPDVNVDRAKFNAAIASSLERRAERRIAQGEPPTQFRHEDHLSAKDFAEGTRCETCHEYVKFSDVKGFDKDQFTLESCADCHSVEFGQKTIQRESKAAATFVHGYHLEGRNEPNDPIDSMRCAACHTYGDGGFTFTDRFAREDGTIDAYAGCVSCHTEREIENHGQLENCSDCHAVERPDGGLQSWRDMSTNRPRIVLNRPRPTGFEVGPHSHPLVTTKNEEPIPQECAECHLAAVPEIPSELAGRPFDHLAHLPSRLEEITNDTCVECHDTIADEKAFQQDLQKSGRRDVYPLFDDDTCAKCHDSGMTPLWPEENAREVAKFDHYLHSTKFGCQDCHAEPIQGGADAFAIRVPDAVAACKTCHGHDDTVPELSQRKRYEISANVQKKDIDSCGSCHARGIPSKGRGVIVARSTVVVPGGETEAHDSTAACSTCHVVPEDASDIAVRPSPERLLSARRITHPHDVDFNPFFEKHGYRENNNYFRLPFVVDGVETPRLSCLDCHWQSRQQQALTDSQFGQEPYANGMTVWDIRDEYGTPEDPSFPGFVGEEHLLDLRPPK